MAQDLMVLPGAKRSTSEWRALVKAYHKRNCTQREFCSAHGVAVSTLDWWRRKLERASAKQDSPSVAQRPIAPLEFIDITPPRIESPAWEVELELGQGVVLRLRRS